MIFGFSFSPSDISSLENIRREIIMLKQENQNLIEENSRLTLKFESLQRDNEMLLDKLHNIT